MLEGDALPLPRRPAGPGGGEVRLALVEFEVAVVAQPLSQAGLSTIAAMACAASRIRPDWTCVAWACRSGRLARQKRTSQGAIRGR